MLESSQFAVFSQAITACARIGRELLLHANRDILKLRCWSESKQGFVAFDFDAGFFATYRVKKQKDTQEREVKCKMPLKCCQMAFRSVGKVERMTMTFHRDIDHTVCFKFIRPHNIIKTCSFFYTDCEILTVPFDREAAKNYLTASTSTLTELIGHVRGTDEITMFVDANLRRARLASFHPAIEDSAIYKTLKTDLTVNFAEFKEARIDHDAELTFNLNEFKSIVSFCAAKCVSIDELALYFSEGGEPICVATAAMGTTYPASFRAEIVMSTAHFFASQQQRQDQHG